MAWDVSLQVSNVIRQIFLVELGRAAASTPLARIEKISEICKFAGNLAIIEFSTAQSNY